MSVSLNPVSSSLEGDDISYLGILSSTSTGHQPKISHVFTVPLKGTHLPVRIPVGRQEPLGSHPILGFYLMIDESQDESWVDPLSGEQLGGVRGERGRHKQGGCGGDRKGLVLPWAFLSAFPGVQPLSSRHMPPSGFWGMGELLAPDPLLFPRATV